MKLSAQIKQTWVAECAKRMLPPATHSAETETQKLFLHKVYVEWEQETFKEWLGQDIMKYVTTTYNIDVELWYDNEKLRPLSAIGFNRPYQSRGRFSDASLYYHINSNTTPDLPNESYQYIYAGNRQKFTLTDEQYEEYQALVGKSKARQEAAIKVIDLAYSALDSCNTDTQLKEKYPAIYANMPDSARNAINADIERKSQAKLDRQRAKKSIIDTPDDELSPEQLAYKEVEMALQKAAFLNQT